MKKGGTEAGQGERNQGEMDEWVDLEMKAVPLIFHSVPFLQYVE